MAVAGSGSIAIAGVILYTHFRQHAIQIKATSAKLSLRMADYWSVSKHADFAEFAELVWESKVQKDDPRIAVYLDKLEEVAIFWEEGTITNNHGREFFGPDLDAVLKNDPVYNYLKENQNENTYKNLWNLIRNQKKWKR